MKDGRDYETQYLISTLQTSYQDGIFLYNNVALRKVWEQYAFKCCTNIYQHG